MEENNNILYLCDHRKCDKCNDYCNHTQNIKHAINFENKNGTYYEKVDSDKDTIKYLENKIDNQKREINLLIKQKQELKELNDKYELRLLRLDKKQFSIDEIVSKKYEDYFHCACVKMACLEVVGYIPKYCDDETKSKIGKKAIEIKKEIEKERG